MHSKLRCAALALAALALLAGCNDSSRSSTTVSGNNNNGSGGPFRYDVDVRRSKFGIPHIRAADYASLGYGYGYVHAEDNLCVLAEDLLTIRGERAKYFGRDGKHLIVPNGSVASNVDSDFFWQSVATDAAIAPIKTNSDTEARDTTRGFVAGYNRYLRELRAGGHAGRHAACRDAEWLAEITEDDMYRRYFRLALIASTSVFVEGVATAAPPGPDNAPLPVSAAAIAALDPKELPFPLGGDLPIGSNMYALGADATASGTPMLLGNPHFPWSDTERLYLTHLQIIDPASGDETLNIMGASLYGVPAALIGFNQHFAWSHTVSTAFRFTFYELTLNPTDPTQYLYDGGFVPMEATELSVEVKDEEPETRTLYRSQYGPMLEFQVSGVPVLEWSYAKAYTLRDANAENDRMINQFFRWNAADSLSEFIDLHGEVLGVPWVNTAAVGSAPGDRAYYGDVTVVPNVPDSKADQCGTSPIALAFKQLSPGLPVLDGSRTDCAWGSDDDAPVPGIFGRANLPTLQRDDWVHNCNDSYWLSNPDEPITGFAAIIGDEGTARTLRTRLCMLQVQQRLSGSDSLEGKPGIPKEKFDLATLQHIALDSAVYSAELARQSVLDSYCQSPQIIGSSGPVDVTTACTVLEGWDKKNNLESKGGHIWREFWRGVDSGGASTWLSPFSIDDPVNTPRGLNVLDPQVEQAFADGVQKVADSGFAFEATMGSLQHSGVHAHDHDDADSLIPVFGGEHFEGSFTIANARGSGLGDEGYEVTYGNSYIQTVTWDEGGHPVAEGFVTYSQSTDPASPYYSDMTRAYQKKQWIKFPWTEADIAAATVEQLRLQER